MPVEEVKAWKDRHGTMWESKEEAEESEEGYKIIQYFNAYPIYGGSEGSRIDGTAFWLWYQENRENIYIKILQEDYTDEL